MQYREKLHQPVLLAWWPWWSRRQLAPVATSTHDAIAAAEAADLRNSLSDVLPKGFADNDLGQGRRSPCNKRQTADHLPRLAGQRAQGVFQVSERGYSGEILVLMAVDGRQDAGRACLNAPKPWSGRQRLKSPKTNGFSASTANRWASRRQTNGACKKRRRRV